MISLNKNYKNLPTQLLWKISIRRRKKKKHYCENYCIFSITLPKKAFMVKFEVQFYAH